MVRYEGMEELLQGVSARLKTDTSPRSGIRPPVLSSPQFSAPEGTHARAFDCLVSLYRGAERFHDMLAADAVQSLTQNEHEELAGLLGKVLQELWNCELALQRVAPCD